MSRLENTKRNNDYEYDKNHIIHSLFGDHPVTIRFTKKKNEEVESYVLGTLLDTFNERIRGDFC